MKRYLNKLKKLIYSEPESNFLVITDQSSNVVNTGDQLKVLNDIWTPNIDVSDISINSNILKVGDNDNSINLINQTGINETEPVVSLDINNSDGLKIPSGTVNERPTTLKKGIIRYNLELDQFEGYGTGNEWGTLGGVTDVKKQSFIRAEKTPGLDNNELEFYTSNIEHMIIKNDGKVGIGTNTPNGIFEINNKLLITEQKIQFKKDLIPDENNTLNIGHIKQKISEVFLSKKYIMD